MNDYKTGDKVRVRGIVNIHDGEVLAAYENHVWVKYPDGDHELVVAGDVLPCAEPLPAEPGGYADADGTHWVFDGEDWWAASLDEANSPVGPVVRLVPVGSEREQAIRDVLKYIDDFGWKPGQVRIFEYGQAARVLEHFGYAP